MKAPNFAFFWLRLANWMLPLLIIHANRVCLVLNVGVGALMGGSCAAVWSHVAPALVEKLPADCLVHRRASLCIQVIRVAYVWKPDQGDGR